MKKPAQGKVVQQDVINAFKYLLNVDLSKARDTQFDTRSMFNVDTREMGRGDMEEIRRYLARSNGIVTNANRVGYYEVQLVENGAYRIGIQVRYKKPKK